MRTPRYGFEVVKLQLYGRIEDHIEKIENEVAFRHREYSYRNGSNQIIFVIEQKEIPMPSYPVATPIVKEEVKISSLTTTNKNKLLLT
jgi:hypothetical protein